MHTPAWYTRLPAITLLKCSPFDGRRLPSYIIALGIFAVAFLLRMAFDSSLSPGFPFLTFFPAVMLSTLALGLWPGMSVALLSAFCSWYVFMPPMFAIKTDSSTIIAMLFFSIILIVNIAVIHFMTLAIAGAEEAKEDAGKLTEYQKLLISELDHRIKNLFAVVASVVKLSARYAETPQQLAEEASERILALSRSHASLWRAGAEADANLQTVARMVLEPHLLVHGSRIRIAGQSSKLDNRSIQMLSLMFHELATNSAKYGALSRSIGDIDITSTVNGDELKVIWTETGLPEGNDFTHRGFGTELLERLASGLGGSLRKSIHERVLTAEVRLPAV